MTTRNVWIAIALISAAACGGGSSSGPMNSTTTGNTPPPAGGVSVTNNEFNPGTKTVAVGATVQWAWNTCTADSYSGQACVSHNVTFDDGTSSPTKDQGTYSRMFAAAGTYNYHCTIHGAAMAGSITVQ